MLAPSLGESYQGKAEDRQHQGRARRIIHPVVAHLPIDQRGKCYERVAAKQRDRRKIAQGDNDRHQEREPERFAQHRQIDERKPREAS